MAGIIGLYGYDPAWKMARFIYYGLMALQHRGQESCGISVYDGERILCDGRAGMVDQAFGEAELEALRGWIGIGQVDPGPPNSPKPSFAKCPIGLSLVCDGSAAGAVKAAKERGLAVEDPQSALAALLSKELADGDPFGAIERVAGILGGACNFIALTERGEMIAYRGELGIKPMVVGNFGFDYGAVASESCALDVIGAELKADISPGEAYLFTPWSIERRTIGEADPKYCAFEYVYLARPDSIMNGRSVYEVRMRIGERLALESDVRDADSVLAVPETAIPFAMSFSNATKKPIGMGFVQTGRRVRSAIRPTQFERLVGVQLKLNPIRAAMAGKRIILIDDSVVRGTTTKNTVKVMRNRMGAKEVHVRIGSPRIISQCPFGIEVPDKDELIAAHLNEEEVGKVVEADTFHWLSLEGLIEAIGLPRGSLCLGCFTGEYPRHGDRS
ncbi:MAG: amidophosphoribosyltransferase [Candidatus Bathyarchaeia archaeon]